MLRSNFSLALAALAALAPAAAGAHAILEVEGSILAGTAYLGLTWQLSVCTRPRRGMA